MSESDAAHSKIYQALLKPQKSKVPWTEEEDIKLLQMWNEGRSWEYIFAALPSWSEGTTRVCCSTKFKSDLVQGPVVPELEKRPIASLTLGLLYRRRSNGQAAAMITIQVMEIRTLAAMMMDVRARTSSACWHTRRQTLGLDLLGVTNVAKT
jgi:hypothetical protein